MSPGFLANPIFPQVKRAGEFLAVAAILCIFLYLELVSLSYNPRCGDFPSLSILGGIIFSISLVLAKGPLSWGWAKAIFVSCAIGIAGIWLAAVAIQFFPSIPCDNQITQSNNYWRGSASPILILEHSISTNGTVLLIIQNSQKEELKITRIDTGNASSLSTKFMYAASMDYDKWGKQMPLAGVLLARPGEFIILKFTIDTSGQEGALYKLPVTITYINSKGEGKTQLGKKPIIGKYVAEKDIAAFISSAG